MKKDWSINMNRLEVILPDDILNTERLMLNFENYRSTIAGAKDAYLNAGVLEKRDGEILESVINVMKTLNTKYAAILERKLIDFLNKEE